MKAAGLLSFALAIFTQKSFAQSLYKPLPLPPTVRVSSSAPRQLVWENLTPKQQALARHLLAAAKAGKPLVYYQNHRHALLIKSLLEKSLSTAHYANTQSFLGNAFTEYLNYAAKFTDQSGPYASSNRKYILTLARPEQIAGLFHRLLPRAPAQAVQESIQLLTDPNYEVIAHPEDAAGLDLIISGGNLYERGITGEEVSAAFANGFNSDLNCRIIKDASGAIACDIQALNNPTLAPVIRKALSKIVVELDRALPYASSEHQSNQIKYLIKYLKYGDVQDFRKMNIEWVKDGTSSTVDFMMGYVEVYDDYHNQIGSWESYVQVVDPTTTKLSVNLAKNAQAFENSMPYGIYKKVFPADYSPPAMMVYYFQEISAFRSGGYNLPNFDDIRRDVGAKNIIRLDLPGQDRDPNALRIRKEMVQEFALPEKVEGIVRDWALARKALVLLHEIIGHGSGTYDTTLYGPEEDPIGALGALGSALEEQRADLAALVFAGDPLLVNHEGRPDATGINVGLYADEAEALRVRNSMYDIYLTNFMQSLSKQRSLSEAHQRGHWMLIKQLLDKGAVAKVARNGTELTNQNLVLAVVDYEKFYEVSRDLLAELQRIKAKRDTEALTTLFATDAPLNEIESPWMQAAIERGTKLEIYSGSIEQPWTFRDNRVLPLGEPTLEGIAPYLGR